MVRRIAASTSMRDAQGPVRLSRRAGWSAVPRMPFAGVEAVGDLVGSSVRPEGRFADRVLPGESQTVRQGPAGSIVGIGTQGDAAQAQRTEPTVEQSGHCSGDQAPSFVVGGDPVSDLTGLVITGDAEVGGTDESSALMAWDRYGHRELRALQPCHGVGFQPRPGVFGSERIGTSAGKHRADQPGRRCGCAGPGGGCDGRGASSCRTCAVHRCTRRSAGRAPGAARIRAART